MGRRGTWRFFLAGLVGLPLAGAAPAGAQIVRRLPDGDLSTAAVGGDPLPMVTIGRAVPDSNGSALRQWPGTTWETRFHGTRLLFRLGPGQVAIRVSLDGQPGIRLAEPAPGLWQVDGLSPGSHHVRVQIVGDTQDAPTGFGGFLSPPGTRALAIGRRARQIELIGDSHTVGYATLSTKRDCTEAEVAATTDSFAGPAGQLAAGFGADVAVNAISGRGVVRNYDGFAAPTLPEAWPFALFDRQAPATDAEWSPQLIVVALGTNDFSTPLREGERWADRAALQADFRATYGGFLQRLRARHPGAYLLIWATDVADGEVMQQAAATVAALRAGGMGRLGFVPVTGLAFGACHAHPDMADAATIAAAIAGHVDTQSDIWSARAKSVPEDPNP